jgi:hypothetical protein
LGRALMGVRERVKEMVGREVVGWDWDGGIEEEEIVEGVKGEEWVEEADDE